MSLSSQIKVPAQVKGAVGGGSGGGATSLDGLSDVVITTPADGQFVRYNGTNFVNQALSAADIPGADTAYAHQVPTSDGAGGFTWEDQAGGTPTTDAGDLTSGTLAAARLPGVLANVDTQAELLSAAGAQAAATGTPDGSKYLRDDNSWQAVSATDSTKLPLTGGTMTGYITLGGAVAYNAANVGIGYHSSMPYLQNGAGWVSVNAAYVEFSKNLYFASQSALTGNSNREIGFRSGGSYRNVPTGEVHDLLINGAVALTVAGSGSTTKSSGTSINTAGHTTIGSVSGFAGARITIMVNGISAVFDWDGSTLTFNSGSAVFGVSAGVPGAYNIGVAMSGTNIQARLGGGLSSPRNASVVLIQAQ